MKKLLTILVLASLSLLASAEGKDWGRVSASLESLNHFYVNDAANSFSPSALPQFEGKDGVYAANDFIKVDYYRKGLSAGLQVEGFFPST